MKTHRFIVDESIRQGSTVLRDRELVHQIATVLRLKPGESIVLCDGKGSEANATIESVDTKKSVSLIVGPVRKNQNEPERRVTLYVALLKRENVELVLQKATEIGVTEIVPLKTARTVKLDFKRDRAEKIIREAVEQSGRGVIPALKDVTPFDEALKEATKKDVAVLCDVGATHPVKEVVSNASNIGIFIGPEGGWSDEERRLAEANRVVPVVLAQPTLRGETAAIVAVYAAITA